MEASSLVHGRGRLNGDLMLEVWRRVKKPQISQRQRTRTKNRAVGQAHVFFLSPEGRLMRFPSLSLSRERLNLPFLFFTLGLSLLSWKMRILSSLSSTSISRSASCCSRRFSSSSCDFCCRAARVSSSSLERSSWKKQSGGHRRKFNRVHLDLHKQQQMLQTQQQVSAGSCVTSTFGTFPFRSPRRSQTVLLLS